MRGMRNARAIAAATLAVVAVTACRREERRFREIPPTATPQASVRESPLQPGPRLQPLAVVTPYDDNAYAVSQGQKLFGQFNCVGCHSNGGGGMGPPLMDSTWIYGSEPQNIYETIVEGRPNGMPSFGGHIPAPQVWQLVAYVRSLSGLVPKAVQSARTDHMMGTPVPTLQPKGAPKQAFEPPAAITP